MRIVFFGTPDFAVVTLQELLNDSHYEVLGVVTQPDKRRGRGSKMIPSPVKMVAMAHNLPVWQPARLKRDLDTLEILQQLEADVFVVVAYGQILSPHILQMPKYGCINVHGSILPAYRGAAPIQWSLYHGEAETGVTTMLMDQGMDTGAMLLKATTPITLWDNADNLGARLAVEGAGLLLETLAKLPEITPTPQDDSLATYARLITKDDYVIDWSKSALAIHQQISAFYPNGVTSWRTQPLKITQTLPVSEVANVDLPPHLQKLPSYLQEMESWQGKVGEVVKIIKNIGMVAVTGAGLLLILEVQPAGKKTQSAWSFANGNRLEIGEIFS